MATARTAAGPSAGAEATRGNGGAEILCEATERELPPPSRVQRVLARLRARAVELASLPLCVATRFVPKDRDLWLLGGCHGSAFEDNARHLYQWVLLHRPDIRAVWCSDDAGVLAKLRERELPHVATHSREGAKLAMRAGVVVASHDARVDVHRSAIGGETAIAFLSDGSLIARKGADATAARADASRGLAAMRRVWTRCRDLLAGRRAAFDLVTISSEAQQSYARSAWGAPRASVVTTGLARTDLMLQRQYFVDAGPRRVLFAPSGCAFVENGRSFDAFRNFDPELVDRALARAGAEIFVPNIAGHRPSPASMERVTASDHVHFFDTGDLWHQLDSFDVLVTDASELLADFLLLDRPVVLLDTFDPELLYHDFEWLRCGPLVTGWNGVLEAVQEVFAGGDPDAERRARARRVFHDHFDGRNCERIAAAIASTMRELD